MLAVLSAAERTRAARIRHHEAWRQFVLTRGLLRLMLAEVTGAAAESLCIDDGGGNAPFLTHNPWNVSFNVSHSHDCVVVAIGHEALGVDIERVDSFSGCEQLARVCYHPREREFLDSQAPADRAESFFDIWTRKEARLKATGQGFRVDPSHFCTVPPDKPVSGEGVAAGERDWYTRPLSAPDGYKAAIACVSPSSTIDRIEAATLTARRASLERPLQLSPWISEKTHPAALRA
jgi:4'-phosphopantetheinyl transferase